MSKETFCVGDMIDWDDNKGGDPFSKITLPKYVKKYGAGPFEIVKVINVRANICSCGMLLCDYQSLELQEMETLDSPHHYSDNCPYGHSQTMRESVGHHQWVVIKGKDGIIGSSFSGGPQEWSGSWFKKVKPNTDATL